MRIDTTNLYAAVEDKVATVFFNRPPLNLFTLGVFDELERMFTSLEKLVNKDEVRSVVLTSSVKKAFSAGDDLNEGPQTSEEAIYENTVARAVMDKILNFPIPVIAAVDGYALGGGLVLAMMADYVIAGERAKFGFIYLILRNPCIFKENRHFNVLTLCIFPCFCPYELKQGKLFV